MSDIDILVSEVGLRDGLQSIEPLGPAMDFQEPARQIGQKPPHERTQLGVGLWVSELLQGFFEERLEFSRKSGIPEGHIWLDPGFGFGKTVGHNLTVLRRLAEFKRFGRPVLIGTSNKATIGAVLDLPVEERLEGTAATVALAIANGADAVRVHDVRTMARVARMCDAVLGRGHHE